MNFINFKRKFNISTPNIQLIYINTGVFLVVSLTITHPNKPLCAIVKGQDRKNKIMGIIAIR